MYAINEQPFYALSARPTFKLVPVSIDPEVNGGKPTVAGTRVSVQTVLGHLSAGDSIEDVLEAYPRLTRGDVLACLECGAKLAGRQPS